MSTSSIHNDARQWDYKRNSQSAKNGCKVKSKAMIIIRQKVYIKFQPHMVSFIYWSTKSKQKHS